MEENQPTEVIPIQSATPVPTPVVAVASTLAPGGKRENMELNKALEFAVILAWSDLSKVMTPSVVRVEYESEQGAALDHLRIWLTTLKGNQYLVCEWSPTPNSTGTRFANGHSSPQLAENLDFIMKTQDHFPRIAEARRGLVLVYPADETKYFDAAAWAQGLPGLAANREDAVNEKASLSSVA